MINKIDLKAYYEFKSAVVDIRISKLTQDKIDQLKKQLDAIIKA